MRYCETPDAEFALDFASMDEFHMVGNALTFAADWFYDRSSVIDAVQEGADTLEDLASLEEAFDIVSQAIEAADEAEVMDYRPIITSKYAWPPGLLDTCLLVASAHHPSPDVRSQTGKILREVSYADSPA